MKKILRNQRKNPLSLFFGRSERMKRLNKTIFTLIVFFLFGITGLLQAQYVHTNGKKIIDKDGNEIILRGMGLGGWMLQEGYMLETNAFANPQHQIRAKIV